MGLFGEAAVPRRYKALEEKRLIAEQQKEDVKEKRQPIRPLSAQTVPTASNNFQADFVRVKEVPVTLQHNLSLQRNSNVKLRIPKKPVVKSRPKSAATSPSKRTDAGSEREPVSRRRRRNKEKGDQNEVPFEERLKNLETVFAKAELHTEGTAPWEKGGLYVIDTPSSRTRDEVTDLRLNADRYSKVGGTYLRNRPMHIEAASSHPALLESLGSDTTRHLGSASGEREEFAVEALKSKLDALLDEGRVSVENYDKVEERVETYLNPTWASLQKVYPTSTKRPSSSQSRASSARRRSRTASTACKRPTTASSTFSATTRPRPETPSTLLSCRASVSSSRPRTAHSRRSEPHLLRPTTAASRRSLGAQRTLTSSMPRVGSRPMTASPKLGSPEAAAVFYYEDLSGLDLSDDDDEEENDDPGREIEIEREQLPDWLIQLPGAPRIRPLSSTTVPKDEDNNGTANNAAGDGNDTTENGWGDRDGVDSTDGVGDEKEGYEGEQIIDGRKVRVLGGFVFTIDETETENDPGTEMIETEITPRSQLSGVCPQQSLSATREGNETALSVSPRMDRKLSTTSQLTGERAQSERQALRLFPSMARKPGSEYQNVQKPPKPRAQDTVDHPVIRGVHVESNILTVPLSQQNGDELGDDIQSIYSESAAGPVNKGTSLQLQEESEENLRTDGEKKADEVDERDLDYIYHSGSGVGRYSRMTPDKVSLLKPAMYKTGFSPEEIEHIQALIRRVNGPRAMIGRNEFIALSACFGVTRKGGSNMFRMLDGKHKLGKVSERDFIRCINELKNGPIESRLRSWLALSNIHNDTRLTKKRLLKLMKNSPILEAKGEKLEELKYQVDYLFQQVSKYGGKTHQGVRLRDLMHCADQNQEVLRILGQAFIDDSWIPAGHGKITTEIMVADRGYIQSQHGSFLRLHNAVKLRDALKRKQSKEEGARGAWSPETVRMVLDASKKLSTKQRACTCDDPDDCACSVASINTFASSVLARLDSNSSQMTIETPK